MFDQGYIVDLANRAVTITLMLSAPMLGGAVIIGILVSLFQAVTQINEQTLSFIPKIIVILGALVIFSPWMIDTMSNFTKELILNIPSLVTGR